MASPTRKLKVMRARKIRNQGKKRKAKNNNQGTTLTKAELFGDLSSN